MPDAEERSDLTIEGLPLGRLRDLAEIAATVGAAATVGLFEALHRGDVEATEGGTRPPELARRLDLDPRAVSIVLGALADLDLVIEDEDDRFRLTDKARRHLGDRESPHYEAGGLPLWLENLRGFASLPAVLEQGGPLDEAHRAEGSVGREEASSVRPSDRGSDGDDAAHEDGPDAPDEGLVRFMAAMASAPRSRIERLADRCIERLERFGDRPLRLLDLGGGPGHMSRVFAERGVRAVLFDRPETVDYVGEAYGLVEEPSIELVGGDFLEDPLPEGPFDIALLSNIVHIYGAETNRRLLAKVAQRVRPGGVVAVADFARGRSARAARFALVMLLHTEEGDTYGEEEIGRWLREAGFRDPVCSEIDVDRQVVTAVRGAGDVDGTVPVS